LASTASMPEDWTSPGGSSPERLSTGPSMMPRVSVAPCQRPAPSARRTGVPSRLLSPLSALTSGHSRVV
jgi:hypothetical protein